MIRLSALNVDSSEESEPERTQESIKQAQEAEALGLYNKALQHQEAGDSVRAEQTYNLLLESHLVKEAPVPEEDEGLHKPGQVLKYSAYKNLAVLAENRGDWEKATDAYLEAVLLDDSDVTVWYHIGTVAIKSSNLGLARQAFQEGLRCNPKHWLCLSQLCSVLYAIGDYATCLGVISEALDRDEHFIKGLALRDKIFSEEPYLQRDYQYLRSLFVNTVDDEYTEEAEQHVKEALHLREERLRVIETYRKEPAPLEPVKPLTSYTWAALGECFVALYDHLTSPDDPKSLARRINLESYYKAIVTPDISMPHKASLAKLSDQTPASNFSTEGFQVYKATGNPADNEDKLPKKTAKRKKPPPSGMDTEFPPKRRSARVRTSKKKEEEVNYRELIQSFLPFSLRPGVGGGDDESSQDSMGDVASNSERSQLGADGKSNDLGRTGAYEGVISGEAETLDILTFVKENMNNSGMINLMVRYGISLAAQRNKQWPTALADVYLKVYTRVRKHLTLPPEFHRDNDEVYAGKLAKVILVATELTLEKLLTAKSKSSSSLSPASSPRGGGKGVSPIRVGPGFSSKYLVTDVEYLYCISLDRSIHGDSWLEMTIRVNWAKARYLMLQGQMEIAMIYLDRCTKLLAVEVSPLDEPITVKLVNCKIDSDITLEHVQKKLESLQRCQSLEEVHRLYEQGNYEDVIQLLMPTLNQPQPKTKISELGMSIPERPAQLLLLQDSLIRLGEYKKCLMCTEVALCEAVSQMTPCEAWSTTLSRLFQCINTCITHSKAILDGISQDKLTSLTLNIIKVIEASIYSSDNSLEPPLATAYPWTLLYKIIKHRDKDVEPMYKVITTPAVTSSAAATNTDSNMEISSVAGEPPSIPASLLFMRTAHDQLGRRGWCCNNDGIFLLLYVEALTAELAISHTPNREELVRDLEQCFLCLYGHPSKKAKARGLLEHNSCQIPLTWQNSAVVFNYFKPPELPTFDSKTNTISTEVQNLMRRITLVVPQQELEDIPFDNVQAFIEGTSDEVPKLPEKSVSVKRPVVDELFYLLADFYFKNKEFSKALKFYTHDVCVQPDRSDSWAAMALARKSRLENKLNACEPKSEGPIQKHSVAALRCFNRAMETDSTNSSILEEYGSLCYFLHSHASRQLKQFEEMDASVDTRSSLLQRKQDMLLLSEKCFTHALGMEDSEAWLHHYMLGKIAEKLKKQPQIYLQQYEKSTKYLDEDISSYPRKIPFYSPPEHVLEALEVYYRIHVSILKLLLNKTPDVELSLLEEHIERAAKGPFYQPEHDTEGSHVSRSESINSESSEVDQENSNLEIPRAAAKKETDLPTITEQPDRLDTGPEYPNTVQDHPITGQDRPNPGPERPINVPDVPITGQDRPNTGPDGLNTAPDLPKTPDNTRASASASPPAKECVLAAVDMDTEKPIDMEICAGQAIPASSDALATDVSMETEDGTANPKADVEMDAPVESNNDLKQDVAQSSKTSEDECKSEEPFEIKEGQNADKVESEESRQEQAKGREEEASKTHIGDAKQGENEDLDSNKLNAGTKISEEQEQMIVDSHAPQTNDKDVSESSANLEQVVTLPLTAEEKARRQLLLARCIRALEHCLKRFPQHHKSRYRLAYVAFYSPPHKDLAYCRDLLLGSTNTKPKPGRPVHQGLFNANSKTNMFSSFWRIPEEDIDRPGSFCTHTYKSVDLLLRVLRELNEWDTLLQVSTLLYRTPEAGKKFLRDNERHFQARSAVEFSVNIMTERVQNQDPKGGTNRRLTCDTVLQDGSNRRLTCDTVLQEGTNRRLTCDTVLQCGTNRRLTFDTVLQDSTYRRLTFDTVLQCSTNRRLTFNTVLQGGTNRRLTCDTILQGGTNRRLTFDTVLQDGTYRRLTFDTVLQDGTNRRLTCDTVLQDGTNRRLTFDTVLQDGTNRRLTFDTVLQGGTYRRLTFDTVLQGGTYRRLTFDTVLQDGTNRRLTFDTIAGWY
ncbi:calcineurin-binding protein cabin-1 isoform X3 [Nematostella vectensis]|uniref:calcineurin-binding protein cabin-1 isoform X3 n=1 Tax=Nematostella vectensis TaxID=45351 RepID=UPI002077966B|nr:calcineurin-binding protein cabin-1 isoform X3 [Nematostella vectensis]